MKTFAFVACLPVMASAAAIDKRQQHSHGSTPMGGAGGSPPVPDFAALLEKIDIGGMMAKYGPLMEKAMPKIAESAQRFMQSQQAMKIEQIPPLVQTDAKRVRLTYGPYTLKGRKSKFRPGNSFSMDPAGTGFQYIMAEDFPRDITIIDSKSNVFDEKLQPIDRAKGLYNHHNIFVDLSTSTPPVLSCNGGQGFASIPTNVFMAGAADALYYSFTNKDATFKSGLYLAKDAPVMQMIDVVNYNDTSQVVYTISEMEYLPGRPAGYLRSVVTPIDFSVCSGKTGVFMYQPKNKPQFTVESKNVSFGMDGYLLNTYAHLHDGGLDLDVKVNGKEVCRSMALYGGPGHEGKNKDGTPWAIIRGTTMCEEPIQVRKGDKLDVVATFDMDKHPARKQSSGMSAEAMALLITTFAYQS